MIIIGIIARTVPADSFPINTPLWVTIAARLTVIVVVSEPVRINAKRNSFQLIIKLKIDADIIPGTAKGTTILKKVPNGDNPSTAAASSISLGMPSKNPIKSQTRNGKLKDMLAMIIPIRVFVKWSELKIIKIGRIRTMQGSICVPRMPNFRAVPPVLYLVKAYPPRAAIGMERSVVPIAIIELFLKNFPKCVTLNSSI